MDAKKIDFLQGIAINDVPSGAIVRGVVGSEDAILVRRADDFFFVPCTMPASACAPARLWHH